MLKCMTCVGSLARSKGLWLYPSVCDFVCGVGLQTSEDYMQVILARLDALRHLGPDQVAALRQGFSEAAEVMQVNSVLANQSITAIISEAMQLALQHWRCLCCCRQSASPESQS